MDFDKIQLPSGKRLSALKVTTLQKELGKRRLSKVGKKTELLERLAEHLQSGNEEVDNDKEVKKEGSAIPTSPDYAAQNSSDAVDANISAPMSSGKKVRRRSHYRPNSTYEFEELEAAVAVATSGSDSNDDGRSVDAAVSDKTQEVVHLSFLSEDEPLEDDMNAARTPVQNVSGKKANRNQKRQSAQRKETPKQQKDDLKWLSDDDGDAMETDELPAEGSQSSAKRSSKKMSSKKEELAISSKTEVVPEGTPGRVSISSSARSTKRKAGTYADPTFSSAKKFTPKNVPRSLLGAIVTSDSDATPVKVEEKKDNKTEEGPASSVRTSSKLLAKSKAVGTPQSRKKVLGVSSASRSIQKQPREKGGAVNRFEALHARQMASQPTIFEQRATMEKKHEEMNKNLPAVVKRLATPKALAARRQPLNQQNAGPSSRVDFGADPLAPIDKDLFSFGDKPVENIGAVQQTHIAASASRATETSRTKIDRVQARTGVKTLTKSVVKKSIRPVEVPKSATPAKLASRTGYTPHRGKLKFLDTTKLTDAEFALAVEEGILDTKAKEQRKVDNTAAVVHKNRKARMQAILNVRRKLNI